MVEHTFVLKAEEQFFDALRSGNAHALGSLLDDDFVMVDRAGSVLNRHALLSAIESGSFRFEEIRVMNSEVRLYGGTAIVTGETESTGRFSRYTHVYQEQEDDSFLLVSAQSTSINGLTEKTALPGPGSP